jgi:hypothetical protein
MDVVDPADQSTWPAEVRAEVERLAARCREQADNTPETPSYELSLEHVDAAYEAEKAFRGLLDGWLLALFHATRQLPHETKALGQEGLVVLTEAHRSRRLDRVIEIYGDELGVERLERLRHSGPLSWNAAHREGRLGRLCGVTPLQVAFDQAGWGMTIFLAHWGGESFYWANGDSPELKETIELLTERSAPAIVKVGVHAKSLNTYTKLWPIFVAQFGGWPQPWHEFSTQESVAPERVLAILDRSSDQWPVAPEDV